MKNGDLLAAAETAGFDVLVTTDRNMPYQQNLNVRKIAVVVLGKGQWALIKPYASTVALVVDDLQPGKYVEVEISAQ